MSDEYISFNFTGPNATYTLLGDGGYVYRRSYLIDAANQQGVSRTGELPSRKEMIGKTELDGLQVRRRPRVPPQRQMCSVGCGRWIGKADQDQGYKRCERCRRSGRGGRVTGRAA